MPLHQHLRIKQDYKQNDLILTSLYETLNVKVIEFLHLIIPHCSLQHKKFVGIANKIFGTISGISKCKHSINIYI